METGRYIILLGTNLGNRLEALKTAEKLISEEIGPVEISSQVYETAAWGNTDQSAFLNKVISGKSGLKPDEVVSRALLIEEQMGRVRKEKWEPRKIDIDLLFFEDQVISTPDLTIPHPRLHLRRFTLAPLSDIFPDFSHPVLGKTISQLLAEVNDPLPVNLFSEYQ